MARKKTQAYTEEFRREGARREPLVNLWSQNAVQARHH